MTDAELKALEGVAVEAQKYDATSEGSFRAKSRMWGLLGPPAILSLIARLRAAEERAEKLSGFVDGFASTAEAAITHANDDGKGMRVPFHGDFAAAKQHPQFIRNLEWWAKAAREVLGIT